MIVSPPDTLSEKRQVQEFWDKAACGEELYLPSTDAAGYGTQSEKRFALEPYIVDFAHFSEMRHLRVLEIGVGLGADHQEFARAGASLYGIDLTQRAVSHTRRRLAAFGLASHLAVGDAENLSFEDSSFDVVYSWGVLHHTPDTRRAFLEVWRVLRPGGVAKIMIYHKWSMVGFMLWVRYALLRLHPFMTLQEVYAGFLESPGTKAYSESEARELCKPFREVGTRVVMTHGDLLESDAGQRHRGMLLALARKIWPRWIIRRVLPKAGLFLLIEARK